MGISGGFPNGSKLTPVPNMLFGTVLEQIDDSRTLRCLIRLFWLYHQKDGLPKFFTTDELMGDRTMLRVIGSDRDSLLDVLNILSELGLLLYINCKIDGNPDTVYIPNTEDGRLSFSLLAQGVDGLKIPDKIAVSLGHSESSNIFNLYEQNIGVIGHIMAEELKEAEITYPKEWIQEAFKESVIRNKRNWRYIQAILKGWTAEGKGNGEFRGHSEKINSREWIRKYGLPKPNR